ncbi:modifier of mdg4 [Carabus blaptoides fortunei]
MAAEQFSLCWDNFHSNMSTGLSSLLKSEDLVDVTLAAEGRYLKAHKMVLSVCSPYFRELFQANPCQHPIVFLKDVSFSALNNLLEFMYQGEVKVSQDDLGTFIKTAEALKIKGLTGDGPNQNDAEVDTTPSENNSTPSDPPPLIMRKSLREKSPPPVRKKMLGPASKRFKNDVDHQQQQDPVATETVVSKQQQQQQQQTSIDQLMTFKMEPEETAVALLNEEEVHYDDSAMDDMGLDNSTEYMLETSSKNVDTKGESSSTADTSDAVGENQGTLLTYLNERNTLVHNGHKFHVNYRRKKSTFWRCGQYRKTGCKVRFSEPFRSGLGVGQRNVLHYDGHRFHLNYKRGRSSFWRCAEYQKWKCRARCIKSPTMFKGNIVPHNHPRRQNNKYIP